MKWVVLVIVISITGYTVLTLHYRKKSQPFLPYEDTQKRANVVRLLSAGYQRIPITAERPADANRARGGASVLPAAGGLPADLKSTLVTAPLLPVEFLSVTAAPTADTQHPYAIQLTCTLPNDRQQLGGADLYVRGDQLVLVPTFEPIGGELQSRSNAAAVLMVIPAGALKPGHYMATVVAEHGSRAWPLDVR